MKFHTLISWAAIWLGIIGVIFVVVNESAGYAPPGSSTVDAMPWVLVTLAGVALLLYTRVRVWWHHR